MALPTIIFNADTGSDTAASGAGPGDGTTAGSAVTGVASAHTAGAASTTITLTNSPDLSAVLTDGSHVLWLDTASGRQFSKITAKDDGADTLTVEDSFTIASGSAVNYAIGGKRATWDDADSRKLFQDVQPGWHIVTESDQDLSGSALNPLKNGLAGSAIVVRAAMGVTRPIIQQITTNVRLFTIGNGGGNGANWAFRGFHFKHSGATKKPVFGTGNGPLTVVDCVCGDAPGGANPSSLTERNDFNSTVTLIDCEIKHCSGDGVGNTRGPLRVYGCRIHHCAGGGVVGGAQSAGDFVVCDSIVYANGGDALNIPQANSTNGVLLICRNTIDGNSGGGMVIGASGGFAAMLIFANSITRNGAYGLQINNSDSIGLHDYNNYGTDSWANTSGAVNNAVYAGEHDLAVDPQYADPDNGDFSVGQALKAKGWPDSTRFIGANQSGSVSHVDIGAVQRQESGGRRTRLWNLGA